MKKPTFFLSSTIYDFSDLRSGIKYFLEMQGCTVLASEFNDFKKPLDSHSYQACLDAIKNADYFVLFVGSRVGGWYDETSRISITQREYQEAYDLHKQGRIKLINFVRSDIWNLKEDRSALVRYLKDLELDSGTKEQIANHPTKMVSDAKFINDFLNEIGRNEETKSALSGVKPLPTGNWIHIFNTFKDVVETLQSQIFSGRPIEEASIRRLLHRELTEFLRCCLIKTKEGNLYSPKRIIENFYKKHSITIEFRDREYITVNADSWDTLCTFSLQLLAVRIHPLILPAALSSMAFLTFDTNIGACREEPVYEALFLLQEEIRSLERANTKETLSIIFENTPNTRRGGQKTINLSSIKLISLLHLVDRWSNIIDLCTTIIKNLDGSEFEMPQLRPKSPIPEMNPRIEKESISIENVNTYILKN